MVKIKMIYTCPRCNESTTAEEKPEICGACGSKFPALGSGGYVEPLTIEEQYQRNLNVDAKLKFILSLPIESCNNIMNDALNILQSIPGKKVDVSGIRILMGLAIQIGEIAKAYEIFLASGGAHVPGLLIKSGDKNVISKNGDGETSPAG